MMPKKKLHQAARHGTVVFLGALAFAFGSLAGSVRGLPAELFESDPYQDPFTTQQQDDLFRQFLEMTEQQPPAEENPFPFSEFDQPLPPDGPMPPWEEAPAETGTDPFAVPGQALFPDQSAPPEREQFFAPLPDPLPLPQPVMLQPTEQPFSDERSDSPANKLRERGIIHGYPDGSFKAANAINRAEVLKMLIQARMGNAPGVPAQAEFIDVPAQAWFAPYIAFASYYGIMTGYPDATARPEQQVTTAEFLKMISLAFGMPTHLPHSFIDVTASDWFDIYAGAAEHFGMWPVRGPLLGPEKPLTRGEVAEAIVAVMGL